MTSPVTSIEGPAIDWEVCPGFDQRFDRVPRAIHLNAAGDVTLVSDDGSAETFTFAAGTHAYRPVQINTAGTTLLASQIKLVF